ncbi:MAG: PIN domain-containing protein [Nanoarchaeota archaeon]|nr:PIN domain-containing protein [Nanoarchaeota archaeon]
MENIEKIVPDTSVIIQGILSEKIEKKELKIKEILIHEALLAELEHQANSGKAIGHLGLDELKRLKETEGVEMRYAGNRPRAAEIKYASLGEIDALIRSLAWDEGATLITSDKIQSKVAKVKGIEVIYIRPEIKRKKLKLEKYFDSRTMSVHLREDLVAKAKKGTPGNWEFVSLGNEKLSQKKLKMISKEIIEETKSREDGFLEIEREGSTIIQLGDFRIVITTPPFSDKLEITAVRPVKKLNLKDYKLSEKLFNRISKQAEGILIAGAPGQGKCLAEDELIYTDKLKQMTAKDLYYSNQDKILSVDNNGKIKPCKIVNKAKRREEEGLFNITTRSGRSIKVTSEHPLLIFNGKEVKWKCAKDLEDKDKIATIKNLKTETDDNINLIKYYDPENTLCKFDPLDLELPIYMKFFGIRREILKLLFERNTMTASESRKFFSRSQIEDTIKFLINENVVDRKIKGIYCLKVKSFNLKEHNCLLLRDYLNLDLLENNITHVARISKYMHQINFAKIPNKITPELCRFLGYFYSEGSGDRLYFTNENKIMIEDFKYCFEKIFGKAKWREYGITYENNLNYVIKPILRGFGIPNREKSKKMSLPNFLFTCSEDNLSNFLGAYFDGDGGVDKSNIIEFYTSSGKCSQQLSLLLLRLGIFSHVTNKFQKEWDRFTVRITHLESLEKFCSLIKIKTLDKIAKLEKILQKKYNQMHSYDMRGFLKNINYFIGFKKKHNFSLERLNVLLETMYKKYYEINSKGEGYLLILKEYINTLNSMKQKFDNDKNKLTYSILRNNHMDHNCVKHWEKDRKIKVSTLNKVCSVLGYDISVKPKNISSVINSCIKLIKLPALHLVSIAQIGGGTLQLRLNKQWDTNVEELDYVYNALSEKLLEIKTLFGEKIRILELLCKSDLFFDAVKEIKIKEGEFEVYDFETENHNFICGKLPMLVHNSTFASSLAEFYASKDKIVKTIEAPRDLQLGDNVTQYSLNYGDAQEIHDILLLTRPDYCVFDEMRNNKDFLLFSDLRMAGIGLAGVIHATNPIDGVQRFIGKVELGVIPHVIDTVIFIKDGKVEKVLSVAMLVKVPSGMTEDDLARPVVEVRDFENDELEFEIYSYGEETVVIPVTSKQENNPSRDLAAKQIENYFKQYGDVKVEVVSDHKAKVYVPERFIARIIGKQGKNIEEVQNQLGIHIDVEELKELKSEKKEIDFEIIDRKNNIIFFIKNGVGKNADIFVGDDYLFSATVGRKSDIKVKRRSEIGRKILDSFDSKKKVIVRV